MSAYVVDPRTIDYLVQWANRHPSNIETRRFWARFADVPEEFRGAVTGQEPEQLAEQYGCPVEKIEAWGWSGYRLELIKLTHDELGAILYGQNIRSVRHRYPDSSADDLPGPIAQARVWRYRFRPIANTLNPAWVVSSCDCLSYQSCETEDYRETLAHAITEAIREDAVRAMIDDAPWGVTDEDLAPKAVA